MSKLVHKDLKYATEDKIKEILDNGIETTNLGYLSELVDIHKDIANEEYWCMKEEKEDMYGNYRGYEHDSYGRDSYGRDSYGRRERDSRGRYRGHEYIDDMSEHYGRYEEGRQRYGANEDTKRSLRYMLDSMENFARMLKEEATSQEEIEMIRQTAQKIANM